ncbi:MAG TPA: ATP-binding protein [Saprospiraceae bacterium]|nr:ATP-binding protein [Saprospiraceae bacterium]
MKRPPILLLVALLCLLLAYSWSFWGAQRSAMVAFEKALPDYLEEKSEYPTQLLSDSSFLNYFAERDELRYLEEAEAVVQQLEVLENNGVGLFLLGEEKILLSSALVDWQALDSLSVFPNRSFLLVQAEEFWLARLLAPGSGIRAIVFLPLHEAPYASYLHFSDNDSKSARSIELKEVAPFWVSAKRNLPRPVVLLCLLWLGGILSWRFLHRQIIVLMNNGRLLSASVLSLFSGGLLIWWFQSSIWPDHWDLLRPLWDTDWLPDTLLGLLGQIGVVLWLFRLFYELFTSRHSLLPDRRRWLLTPLLYGVGLSSLLGVAFWLKTVITGSTVFFNLDQVLKLRVPGLVVALSLIMWLMAVFLLVKRLSMVVHQWGIPLNYRLLGMFMGILLSYGILLPLSLGVSFWVWLLLAFIFLVLMDLQLDSGAFNLTWLMVWLILLSTFSASFTYKFSLEKELSLMKQQRDQILVELKQKSEQDIYELEQSTEERYGVLRLRKGTLYEGDGFVNALDWETVGTLKSGADYASITNKMIQVGARQGEEVIVLQKELGSYFRPLSLFALYFSLFLIFLLGLVVLHTRLEVLPDFLLPVFKTRNSLRNRIQLAVIGIILLSSVVIAFVTIWYFRDTAARTQEREVLEQLRLLEQELTALPIEEIKMTALQEKIGSPFALYDTQGAKLYDSTEPLPLPYWLPASTLEQLRLALVPFQFQTMDDERQRLALASIQSAEGQIMAYAGLPFSRYSEDRAREINNFVGSVFSLYVFFMFVAGGIAIWVANSITEPISKIGEGLRNLRLGGNVPLSWKNRDEIGLLVEEYNTALAKLEDSTRQLRKAEREGAWRDMAQQVAHEIKNPLTPMKLSVQHLLRAYQSNPEAIGPLLQRMSTTLIEQIEGLTKIANEFSNFAKMPEAQLERLNVSELLRSVIDLFAYQQNEVDFKFDTPAQDYFVIADKDQLLRVFNNLLTNAVQAIPDGRSGQILLQLKPMAERIQVIFKDNGTGIPIALQEKVFYPYFTTKSSGTGIGLSMCRNIIEQFGGRIYFTTQEQEGTTFYVELQAAK